MYLFAYSAAENKIQVLVCKTIICVKSTSTKLKIVYKCGVPFFDNSLGDLAFKIDGETENLVDSPEIAG